MDIETVVANLRNTITGKELMLKEYNEARALATMAEESALFATIEFLKINIDELKRILQDVEQCSKQASDASWATNPDRMAGAYTEDELQNKGWK